jgi:transcriptional antiterminator RfaH
MIPSSSLDIPSPFSPEPMIPSMESMSCWYLVQVKPRAEKVSALHLDQLGLESFCPHLKQQKIIRRVRREVVAPLFPGYMFVKFDPVIHYRAVKYATGVRGVVSFGDTLARVDSSIIEAVRARIIEGFVHVAHCSSFQPGQKVRIHDGPLQGFEAVFECEMSDRRRVTLLLERVAFQARVVVRVDQIANL